jgi:alpha-tubulin suppressor-like RCC1 family protein
VSCGGDDDSGITTTGPSQVTGISVGPATPSLQVGEKLQLVANVAVEGNPPPKTDVTWSTSDATKATVTSTGPTTADVTGVAVGKVTITTKSTVNPKFEAKTDITVIEAPPPATISLGVSPGTLTLTTGGAAGSLGLTLTRSESFTGEVTLTAEGIPAGVTATITPPTLAPTATTASVSIVAVAAAATGTFTATFRARNQSVSDATATVAVTVQRLVPFIDSVVVGTAHSCALDKNKKAYCWGSNSDGQVGDGTISEPRRTPVAVVGGHKFVALTAGAGYTCGLEANANADASNGDAYCWGRNANGELGDGTTTRHAEPTLVTGGLKFKMLSAGWGFTCGVAFSQNAYCWGLNGNGQLGDGTTTNSLSPKLVAGNKSWRSISAGWLFTCGVLNTNPVWCWGANTRGQVGDGTTTQRLVPTQVVGTLSLGAISAGWEHVCGTSTGVAAYCWGSNEYGSLGDGTTVDQHGNPKELPSTGGVFVQIAAGVYHTCAVTAAGNGFCWGASNYGQVGNGTISEPHSPVAVSGGHTFSAIRTGNGHSCGGAEGGQVFCWGKGSDGALGNGTIADQWTPVLVQFPAAVVIERR